MPDLLTHLCSAQLVRRGLFDRLFPLFALGAVLPDLLSRPAHILFPAAYPFVKPLHSPVLVVPCCALCALLFVRSVRREAFACLLAGALLHLALDACQKQLGPEYFWLFPFSWRGGWIGLFWPEQAIFALPATVAVTLLVSALRRKRRGVAAAPTGS
ncbi:MAG: hypothetical protein IT574_06550 [Candidatus Aureabacteria bacterium]|jgi:hypothetical protein|nr:hypothetical protein [Candidatus Auribacterota bacterium]NLW94843.1 hypothetical protein [Chlamydiota bacterium]HOE28188.1 hypothetical protein [bacterium]HQM52424.1 hypothetical protein [bacterium]